MVRAAFLLSILAAGAAAQETPESPEPGASIVLEPTAIELPRRIGPMRVEGTPNRYDDPRLGVSWQYLGPGVVLSVYLYDAGLADIGAGPDTVPTCVEFENAKHGISGANYDDVKFVGERSVRLLPPDETLRMREAQFEFTHGEHSLVSYVWITGVAGKFLKLRFSANAELRGELPDARRAILATFGEALRPHLARQPEGDGESGAADVKSTSINLSPDMLSGGKSDDGGALMYGFLLAALLDQDDSLRPACGGEIEPPFATEVGLFRAVFVEGELIGKSPFGKRLARVDEAGFLEEFVWTERHRESWSPTPPEGLELAAYAAWKKKNLKRLRIPPLASIVAHSPRALPLEPLTEP